MISYLIELSHIAGNMAREQFQQIGRVGMTRKGRSDYVTHVDKRIEDTLATRIRSQYPDHAIFGEEEHREKNNGPTWIIDPIDGTTNFIRGIPAFAVSIAFCDDGVDPKYGVIYDPMREETFIAERGSGMWINQERVDSSGCTELEECLVACSLPFRKMEPLDDIMAVVKKLQHDVEDIRRGGSAALDLAYTAAGRLDAYWELGIYPWDTAAGELMVRCAGGHVSDFYGNSKDLFGRRSIIAAATPELHAKLYERISSLSSWLTDEHYPPAQTLS